jgi:putative membrane protein
MLAGSGSHDAIAESSADGREDSLSLAPENADPTHGVHHHDSGEDTIRTGSVYSVMRVILRLLINAAALSTATRLVSGISFTGDWRLLFAVALVFGVANVLVRPVVTLLTLPLLIVTLGFFTFVVNALMLRLTSALSDALGLGFHVAGFWPALTVLQRGTLARMLATAIAIAVSGSADLQAERVPIQIYDASNGLAHNRIRCVLADSRGFLWFGTVGGLSRFDGSRFVNYGPEHGLPHPSVEEIIEAGPGVYWVATPGGLARLRSDSEPSRQVNSAPPHAVNASVQGPPTLALTAYSLGADPAANNVVTMTKDHVGRIWIATHAGLFVLEQPLREPSVRRVEPDPSTSAISLRQVQALAEGPDGALWIGTSAGLFRRLPDGRIIREHTVPATDDVRHLLVDRLGRIWIGHDYGLSLVVPTAPSVSAG